MQSHLVLKTRKLCGRKVQIHNLEHENRYRKNLRTIGKTKQFLSSFTTGADGIKYPVNKESRTYPVCNFILQRKQFKFVMDIDLHVLVANMRKI